MSTFLEAAKAALDQAPCAMVLFPLDGISGSVFANAPYHQMTGYNAGETAEMTPDPVAALVEPNDTGAFYAFRRGFVAEHAPAEQEFRLKKKSGAVIWVKMNISRVQTAEGSYAFATLVDISAEKSRAASAAQVKTLERRRVDRMTGLLNRDYAEEPIVEILAKRGKTALFLMDIDNFKIINDVGGHPAGDLALGAFADILREVFPQNAVLARFGGDEFVAVVPEYGSLDNLRGLAGRVLEKAHHIAGDPSIADKISVSIGIATAPGDGEMFGQLYANADKGQYFAKRNGKNRYSFYSAAAEQPVQRPFGADLQTLRRMVQKVWLDKGAYAVEYSGFDNIYQFLERNAPRAKQSAQLALFSMLQEGSATRAAEFETAYTALVRAVKYSLRTGDLMLEFSHNQIAALLVNCDDQNGRLVAERIVAAYEQCLPQGGIPVGYEISSVSDPATSMPGKK